MIGIPLKPPLTGTPESLKTISPEVMNQPASTSYWSWNLVSKTCSLAAHLFNFFSTGSRYFSRPGSFEIKTADFRTLSPSLLQNSSTAFDNTLLNALNIDQNIAYRLIDVLLEAECIETLASSPHFWLFSCIDYAWPKIIKDPEKLEKLIRHAKPEFFLNLAGICSSQEQANLILIVAFENPIKLLRLIEGIISMIGDSRNSRERESIYTFFLEEIMRRDGTDQFIARQIELRWNTITDQQHQALAALKNLPEVQKVIAQKHSTP